MTSYLQQPPELGQPPKKPAFGLPPAPTFYPNSPTGPMPTAPVPKPPAFGLPAGYVNPGTTAARPPSNGQFGRPSQPTTPAARPPAFGLPPGYKNPNAPPPGPKFPSPTDARKRIEGLKALPPITPETAAAGNLRGDVYTPGADPRLQGAQGATDAAGQRVQGINRQGMQGANEDRYRSIFGNGQVDASGFGVDTDQQFRRMDTTVNAGSVDPNVRFRGVNTSVAGGPSVDPMESSRTARYGTAQDQALEGLNGPNRTDLAMKTLADFDAQADVARQGQFRKVGQTAAKFGRIGMGDVNAELGSIEGDFQRDRLQKQNELAASVAEGDIGDRFRRVDATAGLRGMESGIDAGMRGERRTEREYGTGLDERNVGRAINERDTAMGLGERNVGRQMDERNFRASLDSQNMDRGRNERDLETALGERNIGRRQSERDTRLNIATGNEDRRYRNTSTALGIASDQTDRGIGDVFDQFNAAGTLEDRIFGQGRQNRDEFRDERGYQEGAAQRTIENRIREREVQQQEEEMRLRRSMMQAQAGNL